jgi:hypothetical protein
MNSSKVTMTEKQLSKQLAREWHKGWMSANKAQTFDIKCRNWKQRDHLIAGFNLLQNGGFLPKEVSLWYSSSDTVLHLKWVTAKQRKAEKAKRSW